MSKYYTETNEWALVKDSIATVGISEYAKQELGAVVHVELPPIGKTLRQGEEACVLESTKAAADVYSPLSGKVVEVNHSLIQDPSLLNLAAEGEGWLYRLEISHRDEIKTLMDQGA